MAPIFLFPPLGVKGKFSLPGRLSREPRAAVFSQRSGVPVLWWEGRQRRHDPMLLFISILSCVWIWLQVAKSIFSFCGWHHRRPVYFFWAPPHLLPMSCAVADVCRDQEGKQTVSVQPRFGESGKRAASTKNHDLLREVRLVRALWFSGQFEGRLNGSEEGVRGVHGETLISHISLIHIWKENKPRVAKSKNRAYRLTISAYFLLDCLLGTSQWV